MKQKSALFSKIKNIIVGWIPKCSDTRLKLEVRNQTKYAEVEKWKKCILKYQITWTSFSVISLSSATRVRRTMRQNEGLKCTTNLQLIDSCTPWMIVSDSGEHHYTCSLFPFFIMKSEGGRGGSEVKGRTAFVSLLLKWKLCSIEILECIFNIWLMCSFASL